MINKILNGMSFPLQNFSTSGIKQLMNQSLKSAIVIQAFGFERK
jgi:hypothetical protein